MQYLEMKGNLVCLKKKIEKRKFVSKFREMLGRLSDEDTESEDELLIIDSDITNGIEEVHMYYDYEREYKDEFNDAFDDTNINQQMIIVEAKLEIVQEIISNLRR
tara:strand:- start:318 stop:632 length:315 start_codon:yes stop_codon:yes gene_type:complete